MHRHHHFFRASDEAESGGFGRGGRGRGLRHMLARHGERHGRGGRTGRLFDYGDLRLLILAMIAEQPRHGYELIKAIEEKFGGAYSPSPGVIYPTLAWLDDSGFAQVQAEGGGRKLYAVTPEGQAFLAENQAAVDALLARAASAEKGPDRSAPDAVLRGMENLRTALKLRLRRGGLTTETALVIAEALDAAAKVIEGA